MLKNLNKMVVMLAFTTLIVSCKDDKNTPEPFEAKVSIVQVLEDVEKVDFHVGAKKINTTSISKAVFDQYYIVLGGNQKLSVFEEGKTDTLLSLQENIVPTTFNSVFVYGNEEASKWLFAKDNMNAPESGKAKVRVVNLLENNVNAHVFVDGTDAAWVANAEPKKVQNFFQSNVVTDKKLSVFLGEETEAVAEIETVKVEAGKIYSLVIYQEVDNDVAVIKAKLIEQK